ncbi:hypothetical protein TRIUR3_25163 [Triticum urartu]|uniref:F-box associated domain-containing protein n=1 Tax=Triticum urartu TaxID=4572 RepID=M7ZRX1_TRIUA|nr:hypothetical protein TRIUR3_25163 [Triticum urartu]
MPPRLVSDPAFCRRFRLRHRRNPPLLGFFDIFGNISFIPTLEAPNRIPPGRFSLQLDHGDGDFMSLGCRHGLVLIYLTKRLQILVWDPVTADQHRLAIPPGVAACGGKTPINGAVLRAPGDVQHFQTSAPCVYSSKTGLWGDPISTLLPYQAVQADVFSFPTLVSTDVAVLAGDSLHWVLAGNFNGILEFDLEKQRLAVIRLPDEGNCWKLMRAEGGGLGLLGMSDSNGNTQLWKRKTNCDGVASWVLGRTIDLENILPLKPEEKGTIAILGLAEDNNVLLLWTIIGLFVVDLESLKFKKLFQTMIISQYYPFESVYTAAWQFLPYEYPYNKTIITCDLFGGTPLHSSTPGAGGVIVEICGAPVYWLRSSPELVLVSGRGAASSSRRNRLGTLILEQCKRLCRMAPADAWDGGSCSERGAGAAAPSLLK